MADKTALNTGQTNYANLVFACGFAAGSGNFFDLVGASAVGVVNGTVNRSSDATHGEYADMASSDASVNFGDNVNWDGHAQMTGAALIQNNNQTSGNEVIFQKLGSGTDSFLQQWLTSENVFTALGGSLPNASITDGLDNGGTGDDAQLWNVVGFTWDGTTVTCRVNSQKGTNTGTGSIPATGHDLIVCNNSGGTQVWDGKIAGMALWDTAFDDTDWAEINVANYVSQIFAAEGGGGGNPWHYYRQQ